MNQALVSKKIVTAGKRLRGGGGVNGCANRNKEYADDESESEEMQNVVLTVTRLLRREIVRHFPNVRKVTLGDAPNSAASRNLKYKPSQKLHDKMLKVLNDPWKTSNTEDSIKSGEDVEEVITLRWKNNNYVRNFEKEMAKRSKNVPNCQMQDEISKYYENKQSKDESTYELHSHKVLTEDAIFKNIFFENNNKTGAKSENKTYTIMDCISETKCNKKGENLEPDTKVCMLENKFNEIASVCKFFTQSGITLYDAPSMFKDNGNNPKRGVKPDEVLKDSGEEDSDEMNAMCQLLFNMADIEENIFSYDKPMEKFAQQMFTIWENVDMQESQYTLCAEQPSGEDSTLRISEPDCDFVEGADTTRENTNDHLLVDGSLLCDLFPDNADVESYDQINKSSTVFQDGDVDWDEYSVESGDSLTADTTSMSKSRQNKDQAMVFKEDHVYNINVEEPYRIHNRTLLDKKVRQRDLEIDEMPYESNKRATESSAATWQEQAPESKHSIYKEIFDNLSDIKDILHSTDSVQKCENARDKEVQKLKTEKLHSECKKLLGEKLIHNDRKDEIYREEVGNSDSIMSPILVKASEDATNKDNRANVKSESDELGNEKHNSKHFATSQPQARKTNCEDNAKCFLLNHYNNDLENVILKKDNGSKEGTDIKWNCYEQVCENITRETANKQSKGKISVKTIALYNSPMKAPDETYIASVGKCMSKINDKAALHLQKTEKQMDNMKEKSSETTLPGDSDSKHKPLASSKLGKKSVSSSSKTRIEKDESSTSLKINVMEPKSASYFHVDFMKPITFTSKVRVCKCKQNRSLVPPDTKFESIVPSKMNGERTISLSENMNGNKQQSSRKLKAVWGIERQKVITENNLETMIWENEMQVKSLNNEVDNFSHAKPTKYVAIESKETLRFKEDSDAKQEDIVVPNKKTDLETSEDGIAYAISSIVNTKDSSSYNSNILPKRSSTQSSRVDMSPDNNTTNVKEQNIKSETVPQIENEKHDTAVAIMSQEENSCSPFERKEPTMPIRKFLDGLQTGKFPYHKIYLKPKEDTEDDTHSDKEDEFVFYDKIQSLCLQPYDESIKSTDEYVDEIDLQWEFLSKNMNINENYHNHVKLQSNTIQKEAAFQKEDNSIIKISKDSAIDTLTDTDYNVNDFTNNITTGKICLEIHDELHNIHKEDKNEPDICLFRKDVVEGMTSNSNVNNKLETIESKSVDILEPVSDVFEMDTDIERANNPSYLNIYEPEKSTHNEIVLSDKSDSDIFFDTEESLSKYDINKNEVESNKNIIKSVTLSQAHKSFDFQQTQYRNKFETSDGNVLFKKLSKNVDVDREIIPDYSFEDTLKPINLLQNSNMKINHTERGERKSTKYDTLDPLVNTVSMKPSTKMSNTLCPTHNNQLTQSNLQRQGQCADVGDDEVNRVMKQELSSETESKCKVLQKNNKVKISHVIDTDLLKNSTDKLSNFYGDETPKYEMVSNTSIISGLQLQIDDVFKSFNNIGYLKTDIQPIEPDSQDTDDEFYPALENIDETNSIYNFKCLAKNNNQIENYMNLEECTSLEFHEVTGKNKKKTSLTKCHKPNI